MPLHTHTHKHTNNLFFHSKITFPGNSTSINTPKYHQRGYIFLALSLTFGGGEKKKKKKAAAAAKSKKACSIGQMSHC
jgi:hypothetical protein